MLRSITTVHRPVSLGAALAAAVAIAIAGCGAGAPSTAVPSTTILSTTVPGTTTPRAIAEPYTPVIDPAGFSATIDNPFFPLVPGTRMIYDGRTADGVEHTVVEVTHDTRVVMGVTTVVVHDTVTRNGQPLEDTYDWYAQDRDGNVWYFGEATRKTENGTVDTSGSFEAGVDGALPGIIMPAKPLPGDRYRQEYAKGVAEDTGSVLDLTATESAPYGGSRTNLLLTEDLNPLDPSAATENKYYARGVGLLVVVHTTGPAERLELTAIEHTG